MMEYWFLLPVGVLIAALAMSSGIAGSNFWIPVYLLWLGLEPRVAFWVSLLTMLFGFGSGVWRNLRAGTIEWYLVRRYLAIAGPAAVAGALGSTRAPVSGLLLAFAAFVLIYGARLLVEFVRTGGRGDEPEPHRRIRWPVGALAGVLQGGIASGSGTLLMPAILHHRRIRHHAEAVGSTVALVFALSLLAVLFRVDARLLGALVEQAGEIASIMLFAAPGVVVGGQLGPRLAQRLPRRYLRPYLGVLLIVVGVLVGWRALGTLS